MTHSKREKLTPNNKDTRWDRIRKKHCNNISTSLKSEAVKRFIEMDYIGKQQHNLLNGNESIESNLNPVLVMDLRHKMFKKIPRKLPIATVAYSKNLEHCKEHNASVEDHYIENQLNQFRMHLQKQHKQNKTRVRSMHSLLIDNTDIVRSLESTQKHIKNFYNTPIEALQEVDDLFSRELKKHEHFLEDEDYFEAKDSDVGNEHTEFEITESPTEIERDTVEEKGKNTILADRNVNQMNEFIEPVTVDNALEFMDKRLNEFNLNNEIIDLKSIPEVRATRQGTPSPLANTDEILKPLREVIEEQKSSFHLRCVRFDDDINICQLEREASIGSNTSDGIDSVISDLTEEALKELQVEEEEKSIKIFEENSSKMNETMKNLSLNECSSHTCSESNTDLVVTGKVPYFVQRFQEVQEEKIHSTGSSEDTDSDAHSNREQSKIIEELFQSRAHTNISIMRKYFKKWIHYTTIEKIDREHVDSRAGRLKKINIFLSKISIEKTRWKKSQIMENEAGSDDDLRKNWEKKHSMTNLKINKKYQNKIKVQQDIIDLQRLKLERQERIIMELKLHKLSEEAKEARQELKNELKSVIRSGDPKSKSKAKCLQLVGNLKDEDDHLSKLEGKALLVPKFLQNMQERALERSIRHEQAKQRRLQKEAEREAQKLALEEAKRLEDEEAKRMRIEALKEKRRQEKMAKIIKERERLKYLENQHKAQTFYRRLLLERIGMEGFKRLLQRKRDNIRKCQDLRRSLYKKAYFEAWFCLYRILRARRNQKADELYEKIIKRKYVNFWLHYVYEERSKFNVAVDYNELKLIENMFKKWLTYMKRMQMIEETKMKQASSHHEWHLKWKVLDCWRRLPQILQLERETEERRQRWRLKIWELLPDYTPNSDELNFI